jgi:iron complex transport system ATP-binding protein
VEEAVDRCGVGPLAEREYASPSGGERQPVLPARALARRPRVSPSGRGASCRTSSPTTWTSGPGSNSWSSSAPRGFTTLAVLHDLELAAWLRDRPAVLHEDAVMAAGPVLGRS